MMRALIIFAKLPRAGEVKTRLGRALGMKEAAAIYDSFARHAFSLGNQLLSDDLKVYLFYDPKAAEQEMRAWVGHSFEFARQAGDTLGERMQAAFVRTFEDGSVSTVIIGTDIPDLTVDAIVRSFDLLSLHDIVIGPSSDGGYYLLGMNAPLKYLFKDVVWSSPDVLRKTIDNVTALGLSYILLNELDDIDTEEDYTRFSQQSDGVPSSRRF